MINSFADKVIYTLLPVSWLSYQKVTSLPRYTQNAPPLPGCPTIIQMLCAMAFDKRDNLARDIIFVLMPPLYPILLSFY
ncbi:MAG: hypothetical protein HY279_11380 [Nitrospinae bacterium]|nr:hypothetical protein [Nitrospinota bacterium]